MNRTSVENIKNKMKIQTHWIKLISTRTSFIVWTVIYHDVKVNFML